MRSSYTAIVLSFLFLAICSAQAQSCGGLTSITEGAALVYPPIARAAHVEGNVIMLTTFHKDGTVETSKAISGPEMLRKSAIEFVSGWRANTYSGPRNCPTVIRFYIMNEENAPPAQHREDLQHVSVFAPSVHLETQYSIVARLYRR